MTLDQQRAVALASARARMAAATPQSGYDRAKAAFINREGPATAASRVEDGSVANLVNAATYGHAGDLAGFLNMVGAGVSNGIRTLTGQPIPYTADEAFRGAKDAANDLIAGVRKQYPNRSALGSMMGSVVAPGAMEGGKWVAGAKSLPGLAARSALVSGTMGGLNAGGEAKPGHVTEDAVKGGLSSAALGAALPVAMTKGGEALARIAAPVLDPLAARIAPLVDQILHPTTMNAPAVASGKRPGIPATLTDPQRRAALAIKNALDRDRAAGVTLNPDVAPMHGGGDNLTQLYELAAKSPGPARQMIRDAVKQSRQATFRDVESDLGKNLGGRGDYLAALDRLIGLRRDNAAKGMAQIGDHLVTLDQDSVLALRSDRAKAALKEAAANGLSSPDPEVRASAANLNRLSDLVLDKPSAQTMTVREAQDVSEALLSAADAAYKGGDGARGKALKTLGRAIRTNARTPERGGFTEYDDFLKNYASDSDAKNALELGRNVLADTQDNTPEAISRELADMGEGVLPHYQKGVGEALLHNVRKAGGDVRVMRTLLNDRNVAAKVRMAFPDDEAFARFMQSADQRVTQADINNRLMGGSPTEPMRAARADLEGNDNTDVVLDVLTGDVRALGKKGAKAAFKKLGLGVSPSALTDQRANALIGQTASNADDLTALLNQLQAARRLAAAPRIGGAVAPAVIPAVLPRSKN